MLLNHVKKKGIYIMDFLKDVAPYLIAVLTGLATYLKVKTDREKTKGMRDEDSKSIRTEIEVLKERMKGVDLLQNDVKEMKESIIALNVSVNKLLGFLSAKYNEIKM